jgi:hypothetical protein
MFEQAHVIGGSGPFLLYGTFREIPGVPASYKPEPVIREQG